MTLRKSILALALVSAATPAFAATQGTPGPTSTGTVTINASITPEVNITDLNDIAFSNQKLRTALAQGADAHGSDAVCVWSNNVDGSYYITATGDGASNAFSLTDGTKTLPYAVSWTDTGGTATALTAGTKSAQFLSNAIQPDCAGATDATLTIAITSAGIQTMTATTTYSGVLTLLVTPS